MSFRVCRKCKIPHIENCETCFGWGLRKGVDWYPIIAGEAHGERYREFESKKCPECGSGFEGYKEMNTIIAAAERLLKHIEENDVYDEYSSDGNGFVDVWRSDKFDELVKDLKEALEERMG